MNKATHRYFAKSIDWTQISKDNTKWRKWSGYCQYSRDIWKVCYCGWQAAFISDLQKYAGLKSAIQSLTQDLDTLRKEIALLKTQKEDLHHDYQKTLSESVHSRQAVNFLQGSVFSLRNEIMALALIWAFIIYLLKSQVQDTHELQLHQSDEF